MIVCFSGTGNTRRIADQLQDILGDEIIRLAPGLMLEPHRVELHVDDGRIIWAFPVHSWGMPDLVARVIRDCKITSDGEVENYMVCSCGDDIGNTAEQWRKAMRERGWTTRGAFSVQMPNSYTALKGFDVDSPEVEAAKLEASHDRVEHIAEKIADGSDSDEVVKGSWPWFKTNIINPLFVKFLLRTSPFHATDACNSCGRCVRNCPLNIIELDPQTHRPVWTAEKCNMCLRCYHICPNHAVAYGKATSNKGQYVCPGFSLNK